MKVAPGPKILQQRLLCAESVLEAGRHGRSREDSACREEGAESPKMDERVAW